MQSSLGFDHEVRRHVIYQTLIGFSKIKHCAQIELICN